MRKLVIPKYYGRPSIGLALFGCTNRPFYHICVFPDRALGRRYESNILEQVNLSFLRIKPLIQVGTFDPLPNTSNEKLVALNFGRLKYWIGERNAHISVPVLELLGLYRIFSGNLTIFRSFRALSHSSEDVHSSKGQSTSSINITAGIFRKRRRNSGKLPRLSLFNFHSETSCSSMKLLTLDALHCYFFFSVITGSDVRFLCFLVVCRLL